MLYHTPILRQIKYSQSQNRIPGLCSSILFCAGEETQDSWGLEAREWSRLFFFFEEVESLSHNI